MILITLILSLELVQRKLSPPQKTAEISEHLKSAIAAAETEIEGIRRRLAENRARMMQVAGLDQASATEQVADLEQQSADLRIDLEQVSRERNAAQRREQAAQRQEQQLAEGLKQELDRLKQDTNRKKDALEKLRESNRMVFNPSPNGSKSPWLVEIAARQLLVAEWGRSAPPHVFQSASELSGFVKARRPSSEYFVLFVKPDGVEQFEEARQILEAAGFDVGFDLLNSDQTVVDPKSGAAVQ